MGLSAGTRLGPYEIHSALGKGGMGEVYRATDTRLGRIVAIKILPPDVAGTPDVRRRFEQEARAVSALNHPHICTLHDIGHDSGVDYLVLEFVDGESLADRIARRALPLDRALQYGIEIADALAAAHRHGIVHRDLKPANVVIGAGGAKLLDFGLAKHVPIGFASGASEAETAGAAVTGAGTILGTLQYMAPEQLEGRDADARSDIFAFGLVFYEMLTGQRAFDAPTQAGVVAAIMSAPPPRLSPPRSDVSPVLEHVVERCLSKNPADRWQSAADVKIELQWIASLGDARPSVGRRRSWSWAALAVVAVLGSAAAGGMLTRSRPVTRTAARFALVPTHPIAPTLAPIAISRDGSQIAYVGSAGDTAQIYLRRLDRFDEQPLAGTEGASVAVFSPDGTWLAFVAAASLRTIPVAGGPALTVADNASELGIDWSNEEEILYTSSRTWGVMRVPAHGGTSTIVTTPDASRGELRHVWPQALPDGRSVLFSVGRGLTFDASNVETVPLQAGRRTVILDDGGAARYASSGHLLFLRGERLFAAAFDASRLKVTGPATPMVESLLTPAAAKPDGAAVGGTVLPYAMSASGHLVYVPAMTGRNQVVWTSLSGAVTPIGVPSGNYVFPVLSPDGRYAAVTINKPETRGSDVAVIDVNRGTVTTFATGKLTHIGVWTPDGERIVFSSDRNGAANLFIQPRDGSRPPEQLLRSSQHQDPGSCSPDGRLVAYAEADPTNKWDLWTVPLDEPRTPKPFRRTPASEYHPMISPDGRWIAYTSDESGAVDVFVERFPNGGRRQRVSTAGGDQPLWSRDGRTLYYRSAQRVMAVDIARSDTEAIALGNPRGVFAGAFQPSGGQGWSNYSISPDGSRFLMIAARQAAEKTINVVLEWFDELNTRVSAK